MFTRPLGSVNPDLDGMKPLAPPSWFYVYRLSAPPRLLRGKRATARLALPAQEQHTAGVHNIPGPCGRCEEPRGHEGAGLQPIPGSSSNRVHSPVNGVNIHPPSTWLGLPAGQALPGAAPAARKCLLTHQLQAGLTRGERPLPAGLIPWAHSAPSPALQGQLRPQTGGHGQ